jgi:hypothetical protein
LCSCGISTKDKELGLLPIDWITDASVDCFVDLSLFFFFWPLYCLSWFPFGISKLVLQACPYTERCIDRSVKCSVNPLSGILPYQLSRQGFRVTVTLVTSWVVLSLKRVAYYDPRSAGFLNYSLTTAIEVLFPIHHMRKALFVESWDSSLVHRSRW